MVLCPSRDCLMPAGAFHLVVIIFASLKFKVQANSDFLVLALDGRFEKRLAGGGWRQTNP